ncbi:MAG: hypothetical protein CO150_00520 [Nitrospirae bacterium CG_4_9_14_3_um_filter_53_35]|nr:MAG: hypothetical protein AUK29_03195 [Nitrospirae bacterium CG2_30_53_67]PIS37152.1 MAG: hypothetical protein COT35_07480 [Nitrospirae bacterium CG08_land_8_20_14_0_20_52_24]PIV82244.1 MAG: hypothetical protein COW52_14625 [Nitrospirae bacterium CG17_big_fil_post_rev_8_21_14_2_50_50_9]PIW84079.1 MAG: hypothetical protein COZ95_11700 [Nitrospirae bacterium CG_4_8_14_3_um_filter_50_41]PIX85989.1 MAG: hypothetical protein COZ32_05640 [Nitrospirae bacterium CG_4_10_14_3_um_filter_53_41]PJA7751
MVFTPLRILIVDSDQELSAGIRKIFQDGGYEVNHCAGSSAAIRTMEQDLFHFVLIHSVLPEKEQLELMDHISRFCSGLPFFYLFWYVRFSGAGPESRPTDPEGGDEWAGIRAIKMTMDRLSKGILRESRGQEMQRDTLNMVKEFQESNQRLMELGKKKNACLAAATHELRTPLTILGGYQKLLLSESFGPLNEKQKHLLKESGRNCRRLIGMVNSMLDRCRLESESAEFHFQYASYLKTLKNILEQMRNYIEENGITLHVDFPEEELMLTFDAGAIEQVHINLIGNAVKFTPSSGKITVKCENTPDGILTQIMDTGVGIDAEEIGRVFDEFNNVGKRYGEKKGAGLGLSICKKIIQAHGGRIWVESRTGKGSCFSFLLPRETVDITAHP